MHFHQSTAVAVIAAAIGGVPRCSHAFMFPPQQNVAQRTSAIAAETLTYVIDEAAEAVEEMKQTAQKAELLEIQMLKEQAKALEAEAAALEQEATALEEEEAALSSKVDATPLNDATTPLDAAAALEALETLEDSTREAKVEEVEEPKAAVATDIQQVRDGIENRAARRMSLRERLSQIDAKANVGNSDTANVSKVAVAGDVADEKVGSSQTKVEPPAKKRSVSLRELVSSR